MDRREAISRVAYLLGGTVIGSSLFLEFGCNSNSINDLFDKDTVALLDEIAETILPRTDTPGAKDAKVGAFMSMMVKDCYTPEDQKIFMEGLNKLEDASGKLNGKKFMESSPAERKNLLIQLDKEDKDFADLEKKRIEASRHELAPKTNFYDEVHKLQPTRHYFRMLKELTLLGYFTSEAGATKALRYVPVPGKYDGNYPYKKGDRAWAI